MPAIQGRPNVIDAFRQGLETRRQRVMQEKALERQAMMDERQAVAQKRAMDRQAMMDERQAVAQKRAMDRQAMMDSRNELVQNRDYGLAQRKQELAEKKYKAESDPNAPMSSDEARIFQAQDRIDNQTLEMAFKRNSFKGTLKNINERRVENGRKPLDYGESENVIPAKLTEDINKFNDPKFLESSSAGERYLLAKNIEQRANLSEAKGYTVSRQIKEGIGALVDQHPEPAMSNEAKQMASIFYPKRQIHSLTGDERAYMVTKAKHLPLLRTLTGKEIEDIVGKEQALYRVNELIDEYKTPEGMALLEKRTGPLDKWLDDSMKSLGLLEKEPTKFINKMESLIDVLYAGAGKQLSDTELKMVYNAWLPHRGQGAKGVMASLEVLRDRVQLKLGLHEQLLQDQGAFRKYRDIGKDFFDSVKIEKFLEKKLSGKKSGTGAPEGFKGKVLRWNPKTGKVE